MPAAIKLFDLKLDDGTIIVKLNLKKAYVASLRELYVKHDEALVKLIKSGDILHNEQFVKTTSRVIPSNSLNI